jgi:hypothetical protein
MYGLGNLRRPYGWRLSPRGENQEAPVGCYLMLVIPGLFLVSAFFSWWELRYFAQGRTTQASVVEVREVTKGRYGRSRYHRVTYAFEDASTGEARSESDDVPRSWNKPAGTTRVQYIPGTRGISRLAGHRSYASVVFFSVCLAVTVVYLGLLFREARQAAREQAAFEDRRRRDMN